MPSRSPSYARSTSRGRSRTRSKTPLSEIDRTRSPVRRTISPRGSQAPEADGVAARNGDRATRTRSRSPVRSLRRSRSRTGFRARSYSRSPSPTIMPRSSKVRTNERVRKNMTDSGQIVVEKLTKNVNEAHLREIFGSYGSISDLDMPMNRQCKHHIPLRLLRSY